MAVIFNISRTICLQRAFIFENQPHQLKVGQTIHNFEICILLYNKVADGTRILFVMHLFSTDEVTLENYFIILQNYWTNPHTVFQSDPNCLENYYQLQQ